MIIKIMPQPDDSSSNNNFNHLEESESSSEEESESSSEEESESSSEEEEESESSSEEESVQYSSSKKRKRNIHDDWNRNKKRKEVSNEKENDQNIQRNKERNQKVTQRKQTTQKSRKDQNKKDINKSTTQNNTKHSIFLLRIPTCRSSSTAIDDNIDDTIQKQDNLSKEQIKLLERFRQFLKQRKFPQNETKQMLKSFINKKHEVMLEIIEKLEKIKCLESQDQLFMNLLSSQMPLTTLKSVIEKYQDSLMYQEGSSCFKLMTWIKTMQRIPFGIMKPINLPNTNQLCDQSLLHLENSKFFENANNVLDHVCFGQDEAKRRIIQYISRYMDQSISSISSSTKKKQEIETKLKPTQMFMGFHGPPGIGKTTLINHGVSKILGLPFFSIPLGGAKDATTLNGHGFTYEGSTPGKIVTTLIEAQCMNPIIYFDEIDKVSETRHGEEIANLLIQLTDPQQNKHFKDNYIGEECNLDLSNVMFIFSYNNFSKINPVLRDRIFNIDLNGFVPSEKITIVQQFLLPELTKEIQLCQFYTFSFSDKIVCKIINEYTREGGVRRLKECLGEILNEFNILHLTGSLQQQFIDKNNKQLIQQNEIQQNEKQQKQRKYHSQKQKEIVSTNVTQCISEKQTIIVTSEHIDNFLKFRNKMEPDFIHKYDTIGKINGMWATDAGYGGKLPIECKFIPNENNKMYDIEVTGNLGKVMSESVRVAKNVAFNKLDINVQTALIQQWKTSNNSKIHVHCPEGAIPKDGPSAGTALTICLYSLLMNLPIPNDLSITGEIDLQGNILRIGGLREKIFGCKEAGVKHILCPAENNTDLLKLRHKYPTLFQDITISTVHTIDEVIEWVFHKHRKCFP